MTQEINQDKLKALLSLDEMQLRDKLVAELSSTSESFSDLLVESEQKICKEWQYCIRRQEFIGSPELTLALMITEILADSVVPIATLSAYLVKYGLDKFCKCN